MTLFRCQTIPQFLIHQFLIQSGLQSEAVAKVDFPDRDSVRIEDTQGSAMTVKRSGTGTYDFTYRIHGVTSQETRVNFNESNVPASKEANFP